MNKVIILEEYKSNLVIEENKEEDSIFQYRCDCGCNLYYIELSKKDSSGNRIVNLVCSKCNTVAEGC